MSRSTPCAAALASALALATLAPIAARAHEVLHEVRAGGAVALRAFYADGQPLAYAEYEVWSPVDQRVVWQKGRTDRDGWLSFVAAAPGAWRVKVVGADAHGLEVTLDPARLGPAGGGVAASSAPSALASALRPLLGVALLALLFGALVALYRRTPRP